MEILQWRRPMQLFWLLFFVAAPLMNLFRIDILSHSFYLFGDRLWLKDSYLFMVAFLTVIFIVLLAAKIFGRAACGWACPRNTVLELTKPARGDGVPQGLHRRLAYPFIRLIFASGLALILAFYLVEPRTMITGLANPTFNAIKVFYMFLTIIIFLDLTMARHLFCKTACPYGLFQFLISDENTLGLWFDPEEKGCLNCRACERACFVGLNPREENSRGCINCGSCILACAEVTARKELLPFLRLQFGKAKRINLWELKNLILMGINFGLAVILAVGLLARNPVEMVLVNLHEGSVRVSPQGTFSTQIGVEVVNGQAVPGKFILSQEGLPPSVVHFSPEKLGLKPGEKGLVKMTIKGTAKQLTPGTHNYRIIATDPARPALKGEVKAVIFLQ